MMLDFGAGLIRTTPFDPEMAALADRHYSRRTVGSPQFLYSGRKLVLRDAAGLVLFGWVWPDPTMRMDGQYGYSCAIFRNESSRQSSDIILEAEQHAIERWGEARAFTYVDASRIRSTNPGCCFRKAGWKRAGVSQAGKIILAKELLRRR